MWAISSNDIQQARDRLGRRRVEIETRYAEDKKALAAENAMIDTLERIAAAFAQRLVAEGAANPPAAAILVPPAEPPAPAAPSAPAIVDAEPMGGAEAPSPGEVATPVEPSDEPADGEAAAPDTAQSDAAAEDAAIPFDILKPGSRWRFNRATRLLNPEGSPANQPPP